MADKYTQTLDRNFYTELNAVYFPQLGYLVAIRRREGNCPLPSGWELKVSFGVPFLCVSRQLKSSSSKARVWNTILHLKPRI
jgi:hypothetical protein